MRLIVLFVDVFGVVLVVILGVAIVGCGFCAWLFIASQAITYLAI